MEDLVSNVDQAAAIQAAKERHAVEMRCHYTNGHLDGYAFFNSDAYAVGQWNPLTGTLVMYARDRFVSFHKRALMPVFQSWRAPEPNHTYDFLVNHGLPRRGFDLPLVREQGRLARQAGKSREFDCPYISDPEARAIWQEGYDE